MHASQRHRVLFVLPATAMGGAEIRLLNMLDQFERIEPVLLGHQVLLERCPDPILALPFEDDPSCVNPYPFHWANACTYARAVARAGNRLGAKQQASVWERSLGNGLLQPLEHGVGPAIIGNVP